MGFGVWAPLIYVAVYTIRPLLLFPTLLLNLSAGVLFGPWWGILFLLLGGFGCASFCYLLGRFGGGSWLLRNPLRLAAALGRVAGLLILVRAIQDIINAAKWKCGMKYALLSAVIGGLLILLPMTTSRAVWVILGILVILVAVLMAIDRLKPGKLLGDGGNVIDAQ